MMRRKPRAAPRPVVATVRFTRDELRAYVRAVAYAAVNGHMAHMTEESESAHRKLVEARDRADKRAARGGK